jgi:predicted nucleic acid-binding Zn finger protein
MMLLKKAGKLKTALKVMADIVKKGRSECLHIIQSLLNNKDKYRKNSLKRHKLFHDKCCYLMR